VISTTPVPKSERLLDLKAVRERTGESESSIYRGMIDGIFPRSVAVGVHRRRWVESEIDAWVMEHIHARDFSLDVSRRQINANIGRGGKPKPKTHRPESAAA
jgi:predicted DNA-binding transcriptional regulator AlpA